MSMRDGAWLILGLLFGYFVGLAAAIVAADAQEVVPLGVDLPIETVYRGQPGDINPVATIPAEPGAECVAVLESRNNESEHPNSDILVGPVTFTNVETASFQAAALTFISTGPIDVAVRLGGDGVFSAGFTLEVTCNPPTTTTSTSVAPDPSPSSTTTSTTPSVTTPTTPLPAPPTTLSPPPVGGVQTGGGACHGGACDGFSLPPWQTWLGIGVVWFLLAGLYWAFIAGATRRSDG